jgi:NAD(P)-dependent dehydrogenase (short-subunit alcohol dehydrogenase family)
MSVRGGVVLVTGGTRGIGRAIALRLAREQPEHVFLGYCLDHEAARRAVAEVEALGVGATAIAADLGRVELIEELFGRVRERQGRLDVFVSNAARASFRPVAELSDRAFRKTMEINAQAFLVGGRLAAELMDAGGRGGRIVAVSSLGSHTCPPGYAALGAAKAALEALARYMAVELAPRNINVNVVCGGLVDTPGLQLHPHYEEVARAVRERTPAGRVGRPEDLAGIVAFLCSPESDWIRGQTLIADGGYSISS